MAKRFIDTALFDDEWFSALSSDGKIAWIYCITKCDHAGIIKINERLFTFQTGIDSWQTVSEELGKTLVRVNEQLVYFIPKFIKFQYPNFPQSSVKQQEGAIKILKQYGLFDEESNSYLTVTKEFPNSYDNDNGSDIDTEKIKKVHAKNSEFGKRYAESELCIEDAMRTARNFKLDWQRDRILDYLRAYVTEMNAKQEVKSDFKSFSSHFISWMKIHAKNVQPSAVQPQYKPLNGN